MEIHFLPWTAFSSLDLIDLKSHPPPHFLSWLIKTENNMVFRKNSVKCVVYTCNIQIFFDVIQKE